MFGGEFTCGFEHEDSPKPFGSPGIFQVCSDNDGSRSLLGSQTVLCREHTHP